MKRVAFYLFWAADGHADDYIPYCLEDLGRSVETIVFVSNGPLDDDSRARIAPLVSEIVERENVGYDVGGYQDALARFGAERLREYRDSNLDSLKLQLYSPAPIYADLERAKLTQALTFLAETLGGSHPLTVKVLAGKPPAARAGELVAGTKLFDPALRKKLVDTQLATSDE